MSTMRALHGPLVWPKLAVRLWLTLMLLAVLLVHGAWMLLLRLRLLLLLRLLLSSSSCKELLHLLLLLPRPLTWDLAGPALH